MEFFNGFTEYYIEHTKKHKFLLSHAGPAFFDMPPDKQYDKCSEDEKIRHYPYMWHTKTKTYKSKYFDYILVHGHEAIVNKNSTTGELEARITLNTDAHVGGVTFDSKNQILYITGKNGKVSTYDYQLLNRLIKVTSKDTDGVVQINFSNPNDEKDPEKGKQDLTDPSSFIIENSIDVLETVNQGRLFNKQQGMDTIYYHNGAIYSSTYTENGDLVKTEIEYERNPITGKVISIKGESNKKVGLLAPAVQGMAFYEDGDKTYLVTASSAKYSNSRLTLYEMSESEYPIEIGSKVISQDGLEGIYINNGEVSGVFEYEDQKLQNITTIEELKESRGDGLNYAGLKLKAVTWDLTHGIENEKEDSNDN